VEPSADRQQRLLEFDLMPEDEFLNTFDLTKATTQAWRSAGKGPAWLSVGRRIYYRRSEIDRWLREECERSPQPVTGNQPTELELAPESNR
jgi:hypothetical protein